MSLYLLQNDAAKTVRGTKSLVVAAESAADAKVFAASHFNGDSSWADATATALTEETLDADGALTGYTFKIQISGAAGLTSDPVEVSVTGDSDDDLDDVAGKLVTALNGLTDIGNAAYSAPNLTVAAGSAADDLGDGTVRFYVYPPSGDTLTDLSALFTGAGGITHEGVAADDLAIALVADTEAKPEVVKEV